MSQKWVLENYGNNFFCLIFGCIRKDSMKDLEERGKELKDTDTRKEWLQQKYKEKEAQEKWITFAETLDTWRKVVKNKSGGMEWREYGALESNGKESPIKGLLQETEKKYVLETISSNSI